MHEFRLQAKASLCLHADAPKNCGEQIVRAHTVQRSGSLSAIAEDGHVFSGRDTGLIKGSSNVSNDLALVGVNTASTFNGFCSRHDNDTFKPADSAQVATKEVAFLMAYRALAYEIYMKMIAIPTMEALKNCIDRGFEFAKQAKTQVEFNLALQGFRAGLSEYQDLKFNYDHLLTGSWKTGFHGVAFSFNGVLPIVSSGTFFPEFDFHGNVLQSINEDIGDLSLLAFNLVVLGQRSVLVFGWDVDPTGANARFVESFSALEGDRMADVAVRFCFEISDNLFARPSWWASVSKPQQKDLLHRLRQNTPGSHEPSGLMVGDGIRNISEVITGSRIYL